jgi:putative ABC transport system permease protein
MLARDLLQLTGGALIAHRLRSFLTLLGISVGIASVVMLTSIGEGLQRYVVKEFTQFGATLIAINPGKTKTFGIALGIFGSERPLTIDDAEALKRLPDIDLVISGLQGNAEIKAGRRARRAIVYGTSPGLPEAFNMPVRQGRFLPPENPDAPRALAVLGHKLAQELFPDRKPLGQRIRVGGERYRVIGVMAKKGQVFGVDLDDTVYIPAARALSLFNREGLMEIDVLYRPEADEQRVVASIRRLLIQRHGRDDVTITTQQQMLDVMGSVLDVITFAVVAIAAISLLVGAIGIVTIMTISVAERSSEIGLLRALGARQAQILALFLGEAVALSALGGVLGLLVGLGGGRLLQLALPGLPIHTPLSFVLLAEASAIVIGLIAGVAPARHAARLDPIQALRDE